MFISEVFVKNETIKASIKNLCSHSTVFFTFFLLSLYLAEVNVQMRSHLRVQINLRFAETLDNFLVGYIKTEYVED